MQPLYRSHDPWSLDALSHDERQRVLDTAAALQQASQGAQPPQTLKGKNFAVLCDASECPGVAALRQAAEALGARVTQIRPQDAQVEQADKTDSMGALLGRLYDGILCHDLPLDVVERLRKAAGKPILSAMAAAASSSANGPALEPSQLITLQALLLTTLG